MTTPTRRLPARPSKENLKKQAKALAKSDALQLADAQFKLAHEYGFENWAALMQAVEAAAPAASPLVAAAARADANAVRSLLDAGANVGGEKHDRISPLYAVCSSDAPDEDRLAVAAMLLEANAFVRGGYPPNGATVLHAAAQRGPATLVRLLLKHGALFWQGDSKGVRPHAYAGKGFARDRGEILDLLADNGPRTTDKGFLAAISAIQRGDIEALRRELDARPSLLTERVIEPELGPRGYFSDPKLFWFIANNPTLVDRSPDNIVDVAKFMIARGVATEDLDYALELVMTNSQFKGTQQLDLTRTLIEAGAHADRENPEMTGAHISHRTLMMTLGHHQRAPVAWLVDNGKIPLSAAVAAGLGRTADLPRLLAEATPEHRTDALGMAVINGMTEAARLCLEAGADPNRNMACHSHSTPLHQAAMGDDMGMLKLLIAHGARTDIRDTLWRGIPLGWARHANKPESAAYLLSVMTERGEPMD